MCPMRWIKGLAGAALLSVLLFPMGATAQSKEACQKDIRNINQGNNSMWTDPLDVSAVYCLSANLVAPRGGWVLSEGHEGAARGGPMVKIASSNLIIDLRGYSLVADMKNLGGLRSDCETKG